MTWATPTAVWLAIDIGGTSTRVASFRVSTSTAGDMADSMTDSMADSAATPRAYTPLARFPTLPSYSEQLARLAEVAATAQARFAAAGVSVGAQLAPDGRAVLTAPNLRDYIGRPFADDLAARLGCTVRLAHDGVCGVLAEHASGALREMDRCAYVTLSTGTGAGVFLRTATTALALSIQVGHQILTGNLYQCLCGQIGCLETLTGGRQLALRLGRDPAEITDPAFWEAYAQNVATGLINLAQLTRVAVVALGGGIIQGRPDLVARVGADVKARISDASLEVRSAALGEEAPLLGAALLPAMAEGAILH